MLKFVWLLAYFKSYKTRASITANPNRHQVQLVTAILLLSNFFKDKQAFGSNAGQLMLASKSKINIFFVKTKTKNKS